MEVTKDKLYFAIETARRNNMNASEIHEFIDNAWPGECPSVRHIRRLSKEFRDGERDTFERLPGSGRKQTETRKENVDEVRILIEEDSSITINQISARLDISHSMVQRIIEDDLETIWKGTQWVPHTLNEINKAIRVERCQVLLDSLSTRLAKKNLVTIDEKFFYCRNLKPRNRIGSWITPDGDSHVSQTARRKSVEMKYHVIVAVSQRGNHYFEILPQNETVDATRYIQFLTNLERFLLNLRNPLLVENMRLIHDNARPHVAVATANYIAGKNIRLLRQPPYSPDCNLCDCYLFKRLESRRDSQNLNFNSREDLENFLNAELSLFTSNRMEAALDKMMDVMRTIIQNDGNYV